VLNVPRCSLFWLSVLFFRPLTDVASQTTLQVQNGARTVWMANAVHGVVHLSFMLALEQVLGGPVKVMWLLCAAVLVVRRSRGIMRSRQPR
jgi:hypothetical protein